MHCLAIILKAKLPNGVVWPFSLYLESSSFSVVTKFQIAPLLMSSTKVNNNASMVECKTLGVLCGQKQTTPHFMRIHLIVQPLIQYETKNCN
jgi:hypothetical protein